MASSRGGGGGRVKGSCMKATTSAHLHAALAAIKSQHASWMENCKFAADWECCGYVW